MSDLLNLSDPFTLFQEKLEEALLGDRDVSDLLKQIQSWLRDAQAEIQFPTDQELPLLRVVPVENTNVAPHSTSTSGSLVDAYDIEISTSEKTLDREYNPIRWAIFKAFYRMADSNGRFLGLSFVTKVDISRLTTGISKSGAETGAIRWGGIMRITALMRFDKTSLQ